MEHRPSISVADLFGIDGIPGAPPGLAMNPLVNRYKTKDDRWIQMVFLQPDKFWAGFCHRIGLAELATDERFVPSSNLVANAAEATALIAAKFAEHDLEHWRQVLADEPGVWAPLATPRETLNDPQSKPNGYLITNVDDRASSMRWSLRQCNSMKRHPARDARPNTGNTPRRSCSSSASTGTTSPRPKTAARSCSLPLGCDLVEGMS